MAHDTAEAIRMLGLSRINLFGASQGGMISMVMAIEEPDLIKKQNGILTSYEICRSTFLNLQGTVPVENGWFSDLNDKPTEQ